MSLLSRICQKLYEKDGQSAVFDFILDTHPHITWEWCEPCEIDSPVDSDKTCLVCASPTEKENK